MFNIKCLSVKKVLMVAASTLALSFSVYATELVAVGDAASDKGGFVTPQCISNAGMKLCCQNVGTVNQTCQLK